VHGQAKLVHVIDANRATTGFFGFGKGREEKAGKNGDDGDDDQQFDEGERTGLFVRGRLGWIVR
jgi:hypothetical protein